MIHKFNKIKSITKGLVGSNIIFPATYILLSANMDFCKGLAGDATKFPISGAPYRSFVPKSNDLEVKNQDEGQSDDVKFVLGRGMVLNLGDGLCGVFVTSDTKEVFIVKLFSEEGWMRLIEHHPQVGQESEQTSIVRIRYDHIEDPRIIKVDHALLEHLLQQLDQSAALSACSSDKEDFWHKIQDNPSWREIAFCYKVPFVDHPIFKEDAITSEFTTQLYKKYSYTTSSCISSKLSISGNVPSDTLKAFEKVGFLLVKAQPSLVHLVKEMLACDGEWATKAAVAVDYITFPAEFVGDLLQFDSKDVANDYSSLRLADYPFAYCYLQEGEYYRLMTLDHVRFLMQTDREPDAVHQLHLEQVALLSDPMPIDAQETEVGQADEASDGKALPLHPENQNDPSRNEQQAHTHNPEAVPTQDARHGRVYTSPRQYTGFNATTPLPPPPPPPPPMATNIESGNQNNAGRDALFVQIRAGGIKLKPVQPSQEQPIAPVPKGRPVVNSIPPPPPPPSAGCVLQLVSAPNQGSGVKMAQTTKKDPPLQSSSGNAMIDELNIRFSKKASTSSSTIPEPKGSPAGQLLASSRSPVLCTNGSIPPPPPMPPGTGPAVNGISAPPLFPPASTRSSSKQTKQSSDGRDGLLTQIREGIKLKKVEYDPSSAKKGKGLIESTNPLFASLHKAMEERRKAMSQKNETGRDIDSGSEPEESDNEWG
ncbi:MAG: WH2 domain-containing protein [Candidatus Cardinium sp.]|nr:WH2 domain-containing protein [Candidatus Cardinium sp.]